MSNLSMSSNDSSPTSAATALPLSPSPGIRIFGSVSFFCLSFTSLAANICLAAALTKYRLPSPSALSFLLISWQLNVADLLAQCVQLLLAVPLTLTGQPLFGHGLLLNSIAFFDTLTYNAALYFSALMTLNRVAVFFVPALNKLLFLRPRIYFSIAAIWLYIAAFCVTLNLAGCRKAFDENGLYFFHNCTQPMPSFASSLRQYYFLLSSYLPVLMLLAYLAIFAHIKFAQRRGRSRVRGPAEPKDEQTVAGVAEEARLAVRSRVERSLLIQSFLICGTLEVQNLTFNLLSSLQLEGQWPLVVNIVGNWVNIANSSMTAMVLLCFNTQVRDSLWDMRRQGGRIRQDLWSRAKRLSSFAIG